MRPLTQPAPALIVTSLLVLTGCTTFDIDQSIRQTNQALEVLGEGRLTLAQSQQRQEELRAAASAILAQPLAADEAVRLGLINSPAMQVLLAHHWAQAASRAQSGRLPNPVLSLERVRSPIETEVERMLAFGLLDVLSLPQRSRTADARIAQARLQLTSEVIEAVTQVRQAWIAAVAARQSLIYAKQVSDSAEAGAELARRMLAVGNFNKLQRARQQAFYADAAAQLADATHTATATCEALIRALGLTDEQALELKLPDRLPDLPRSPRTAAEVSTAASRGRLDIKMAQAELRASALAQGLDTITSFTDIELAIIRNTSIERTDAHRTRVRGAELELRLPVFDWGGLKRDAMTARTLASANRLEATTRAAGSNLRESYSAYRTSYEIALHYRDEIVPLRKLIADENLLRYNGMISGVFELLADSREQISSVIATIKVQQQFWMADAALQSAILGKPMMTTKPSNAMSPAASGGGDAAH